MSDLDYKTRFAAISDELRRDSSAGRGTATTSVRVAGGVTCAIEDGPWRLVCDESIGDGGQELGPDPGVFVRAGLGACLAQGYVMWASYLGVAIDAVNVTVEADYDARGMLGLDPAVAPGWGAVRYRVEIESAAPEQKVREVVEHADRLSSVRNIVARAIPMASDVVVINGRPKAEGRR
jgi:uncharacterized OsmC-like protein